MEPRVRRIVIPLIVTAIAGAVVATAIFSPGRPEAEADPESRAATGDGALEAPMDDASTPATDPAGRNAAERDPAETEDDQGEIEAEPATFRGLRAVAPDRGNADPDVEPTSIGSLNPNEAPMLIEFHRNGAGVERIILSDYWQTAAARRQAEAHYRAVERGDVDPPPLPDRAERYLLKESKPLGGWMIPVFSSHKIRVGGEDVWLFDVARDADGQVIEGPDGEPLRTWTETAPGTFETQIVTEDGDPVLGIRRAYTLGENGDILLRQRFSNLTDQPLEYEWRQYGPGDLIVDRSRYMDRRRFRFGYLMTQAADPQRHVFANDNDLILERSDVIKSYDPTEAFRLWPTEYTTESGYVLSWFATTNRYFALAVHPPLGMDGEGDKSLTNQVREIRYQPSSRGNSEQTTVFTYLYSPVRVLAPGGEADLDLGVYAGPMSSEILNKAEPFRSLGMDQLILYQMSTWCAICTFQWLAHLLLWFLLFLHDYVLFDWGLAIIALVCVVRGILHPITKKSQINMMRFGKQMQAMKPEVDKLQKKYKDDPKKMQQEQLRLFREHGVNPFQMLGCLPMFLQFPVWVALYAMLYFAIELRHEPAFFGIFQMLWDWPFLADLSSGDHFFGTFAEPLTFFAFWNMTGINVLPILMGVVMFIHQKYMTPPPTPNMSSEQIQQQRIMRVMMVVMLPIFLYNAPAGLTLYIMTSSIIGIIESRYIRSHVDQMDLTPKKPDAGGPGKKKKKPRDKQARAYVEAMERAKQKAARKDARSYKKRK